ncbi:DUF6119 family protein [Desulfatiglans anilini]|uniref:DUF6119 family protein n=1 Tax=Desulfatiglans anilini TaxID=90728 RepID=UPI000A007AAF|nr:DUF6119 family protein [Desulfatiglans anilini]
MITIEGKPMAKSRKFSVYLLKTGYDARNALKDEHSLGEPLTDVENLPAGATLYLADNTPTDPWWKTYWGINRDLRQVLKGAIVFLPINGKCVSLTFGHTHHNLKNEAYEYDFGLRATLNAIDPDKIRVTDIFQPEDAKRERIQSPVASDLTFFDINSDESIVKRLTGAVRSEFQSYFRYVTGASNIRISSSVAASEISNLCSKLLEIYERDDFKTAFPNIQNITPIKDPSTIQQLDARLLEAFREESIDLVLTIPEILDHESAFHIAYSGAHGSRKTYDSVFIGHYRQFLSSRSIDDVELCHMKHHRMNIKDENNNTRESFSIYQCMLFDCVHSGSHYHLCDGSWYRIEQDYIRQLKENLDPYFKEHSVLQECDEKWEDSYNESVATSNTDYVCLDKTNISPEGQSAVEPCDLYTVNRGTANLIHIKISTRSASLSHLFNQGTNSVELLRLNGDARDKLKNLLQPDQRTPVDDTKFAVTYGIITAKDKAKKSDALPIFSRISLRRAIQSLRLMAIDCDVVLIKDNIDRKVGSLSS